MRALLITPTSVVDVDIPPTLEALQAAVDGYIEYLPFTEGAHCYINEDGKSMGLPYNEKATLLGHSIIGIAPSDFIVGNMLIIGEGLEGDDGPVSDAAVEVALMNMGLSEV